MKFLVGFLLVFNAITAYAQDGKKVIEKGFNTYAEAMVEKNYVKMADLITPEVFNFLAKDDYIRLMEKTFSSPDFDIAVKDPKVITIGDIQNINNKYYSVVNYSNLLNVKLLDAHAGVANTMVVKRSLESGFGAENVSYDKQQGLFVISMKSKLCAISSDGKTNWKFVALEKNLEQLLEKFLPAQLLKAI